MVSPQNKDTTQNLRDQGSKSERSDPNCTGHMMMISLLLSPSPSHPHFSPPPPPPLPSLRTEMKKKKMTKQSLKSLQC